MSESLVAKPAQTWSEGASVRMLSAPDARRDRLALAEVLVDCVTGGASVSFMWPFTIDDANAWWGGVIETVAEDRTVLFGAYLDDALVGTVQLGLDVPPNQRHRGDVRKLLVHRDARGRGIGAALMTALETRGGPARAVAPDARHRERLGRAALRAPRLDEGRRHPALRALARRALLRHHDLLEGAAVDLVRPPMIAAMTRRPHLRRFLGTP